MEQVTRDSVKEGQFFNLKSDGNSKRYAYQVCECWSGCMSAKCAENGIMTKPYHEWQHIPDITGYREVWYAPFFEDNRVVRKNKEV